MGTSVSPCSSAAMFGERSDSEVTPDPSLPRSARVSAGGFSQMIRSSSAALFGEPVPQQVAPQPAFVKPAAW
jgi:hypothetical protein